MIWRGGVVGVNRRFAGGRVVKIADAAAGDRRGEELFPDCMAFEAAFEAFAVRSKYVRNTFGTPGGT